MIKQYIQEIYLKRAHRKILRKVMMTNFQSIRTIALLSNPKNEAEIKELEKLIKHFQALGKQIFPLIYFTTQTENDIFTKNIECQSFGKDKCNWFGKPKKNIDIDGFLNEEFDVLIDFSFSPIFSLQYIFVKSKAKLKIMPTNNFSKRFADMMLKASDEHDKLTFAKEVIHYLDIINKPSK